jgi:hypothetical protein
MSWTGHVTRRGEKRNSYRVLVGIAEGKRPLGRPRSKLKDNIKMNLREIRCDGVDWIRLTVDRDHWNDLLNTAMKLWVP